MFRHELNEFRNLADAAAAHQGFALLVDYTLQQQLEHQLHAIQQEHQLETIMILSVQYSTPQKLNRILRCKIGWFCSRKKKKKYRESSKKLFGSIYGQRCVSGIEG